MANRDELKEVVREKYGQAASRVKRGKTSWCGTAPSATGCCDPISIHSSCKTLRTM